MSVPRIGSTNNPKTTIRKCQYRFILWLVTVDWSHAKPISRTCTIITIISMALNCNGNKTQIKLYACSASVWSFVSSLKLWTCSFILISVEAFNHRGALIKLRPKKMQAQINEIIQWNHVNLILSLYSLLFQWWLLLVRILQLSLYYERGSSCMESVFYIAWSLVSWLP